jgi:hypothetical protein
MGYVSLKEIRNSTSPLVQSALKTLECALKTQDEIFKLEQENRDLKNKPKEDFVFNHKEWVRKGDYQLCDRIACDVINQFLTYVFHPKCTHNKKQY